MLLEDEAQPILDPQYTFEDIWVTLPARFKVREDPRPLSKKEKDWQFRDKIILPNKKKGVDCTPQSIDISRFDTFPPQRQLIGSCVGEAGANCVENAINEQEGIEARHGIPLSGQFIYYHAEQRDNHPGEGTYGWAVCEAMRQYGACRNDLYSEVSNFRQLHEPAPAAILDGKSRRIRAYYEIKSIDEVALALKWGYRVISLLKIHSGWGEAVIGEPTRGQIFLGGHAEEYVAVDLENGYIKKQGSWGIDGDGSGHSLIEIGYWEKHLIECRAILY